MAWRAAPLALPDGCPKCGIDIEIKDSEAPVRDGTKVPIRIYKSNKAQQKATLYLKAHGGGWVVGGHEVEEAENRYVASMPYVIVVSVDYRMQAITCSQILWTC
jgi:acetyl esterase/lipase